MFNKFPKRSGIYRIHDNIEQLQLRLHFKHINSLLKLPKFDLAKIVDDDWRHCSTPDNDNIDDNADPVQIINIKWQQKILSTYEMAYYKDASNCVTKQQKHYHDWLQTGGTAYVDVPDSQHNIDKTKSKKRTRKKEKLKHQQTAEDVNHLEHIFTYVAEDNHIPVEDSNTTSITQSNLPSITSVMFVYATLQSVDTLLITLRWHAEDHLLHIYPDFTCFHDHPYYIQIDADYSHLYAYGFENCSPSQAVDRKFSSNNLLQLPQVPHWQSEQQLVSEFAMPPKRHRRLILLLEIREARGFEYEYLHVRYHVLLPSSAVLEEGLLEASTQSSSAVRGTHHFGHCWQLTLLCEECEEFTGLCHIFFEVISIDSWQRERVEGFAYCTFKLQPAGAAYDSQRLRCLRPVDSFVDSLNRFFIGGRQQFDCERFFLGDAENTSTSKPEEKNEFHSRYGCQMQRTGELTVNCRSLTQRNCELLQPCMNHSSGMTLDDIMLAYREARRRLEEIVL